MHTLTVTEFHLEAEPILRKIFVNEDQFDQPFEQKVLGRRIVYPCNGYIEPPLIDALIAAAANLGDTGCYISLVPTAYPNGVKPSHCYIPLSQFREIYIDPPTEDKLSEEIPKMDMYVLDSVIYSSSGKWGLMTSHERHGLLGGSPEFIEEIRLSVPDLDEQVYGFIERLRLLLMDCDIVPPDVTRNKWLPGLLAHVYGQKAAENILQEEVRRRDQGVPLAYH